MNILGIDSSTNRLSIAISSTDTPESYNVIAHAEYNGQERFMTRIIPLVDSVLEKSATQLSSVDYYCVNRGPGDFTGTRIGLSIIKTFAMIYKKNAYAINSSDVFCQQAACLNAEKISAKINEGCSVFIVPAIDVKREELFFSVYDISVNEKNFASGKLASKKNNFFINKISEDILCSSEEFISRLQKLFNSYLKSDLNGKKNAFFFCGSAFDAYRNLIKPIKKIKGAVTLAGSNFYPQAKYLNLCALYRISRNTESDINIKPYYVRDFVPFSKSKMKV